MSQKIEMTPQRLVLPAIARATNARKIMGESSKTGIHRRKMGSHNLGQWKPGVSMPRTAKLGVT
jgi:hypothetical protein